MPAMWTARSAILITSRRPHFRSEEITGSQGSIHAQIEEEIFYPALRESVVAEDALDEADVEHTHVEELVAQLEESQPDGVKFEARYKVLSEYVQHHVDEEESTIFSKARKSEAALVALGEQLVARKQKLGAGVERGKPQDTAVAGV